MNYFEVCLGLLWKCVIGVKLWNLLRFVFYRFTLGNYSHQFKLKLEEERNLHSLIYLEAELSFFVLIKAVTNVQ